ncbi:hypothetical protein [Xanthomonas massiliensis]|jgi:hypothetical protein|uniref:hypothetical protein n=1 Tax=Xanthomonas massiliensis TaxID=1720302 RepID=UPI000825DB49|nr:hypothetical protein [Xanthomonas massiliensis]
MSASPVTARPRHWLWPLLLLLGAATVTVAWTMVALASGRQAGWMAVVAALEAAFMLRLGGWRGGPGRIVLALLATAAVVLAANWCIASAYVGGAMGLSPWASLSRMGPAYAWTLSVLANSGVDLAWMAIAAVAAVMAAR